MLTMNTGVVFTILAISMTVKAEYSLTETVWGHRENCLQGINNVTEYVKTLTTEWEEMVVFSDAENIVNKYTENAIFIQRENGVVIRQHLGREALLEAYQEWFASGIVSSTVTPLNEGWFDEGYLYMTAENKSFDEDGNVVKAGTQLVIFKQIGCGFQTHMVVDI